MDTKRLYSSWANLLDLGFEFSLANLKTRFSEKKALEEIKSSLSRQNEEHCKNLIKMLKRLR